MSKVTIPNKFNDSSTPVITASDGGYSTPEVHVTGDGLPMLNTRRVDFIAGVEEALGGMFIEHSTLPEIEPSCLSNCFSAGNYTFRNDEDADELEERAMAYLMAARHVRANTPVIDQEQVKAFEDALVEVEMDHLPHPIQHTLGEALVKAGYKITKEV